VHQESKLIFCYIILFVFIFELFYPSTKLDLFDMKQVGETNKKIQNH